MSTIFHLLDNACGAWLARPGKSLKNGWGRDGETPYTCALGALCEAAGEIRNRVGALRAFGGLGGIGGYLYPPSFEAAFDGGGGICSYHAQDSAWLGAYLRAKWNPLSCCAPFYRPERFPFYSSVTCSDESTSLLYGESVQVHALLRETEEERDSREGRTWLRCRLREARRVRGRAGGYYISDLFEGWVWECSRGQE